MKNLRPVRVIPDLERGLLVEGLPAHGKRWGVPLLEAAMRNVMLAANEFICGLSFLLLGAVTASIVEPHLGAVAVLPQEVRWKFHTIAGACAVIGFVQVVAVIRNKTLIRLWMARCAAPISGMLAWLFAHFANVIAHVTFRAVAAWAVALFIGNALAVHLGETRETVEKNSA